jgi:phosphoribosylanthranilate isomerase
MTKIKICGITRDEDAALAEELGADFLGFIFVPESPRFVTRAPRSERAKRVGVFRGATADEIRRTVERERLDLVQIHGVIPSVHGVIPSEVHGVIPSEVEGSPTDARGRGSLDFARDDTQVIHAFHVHDTLPDTTTHADYILFDTGGGTGRVFDWSLLAQYPRTKLFFLAGGINPDNVANAIAATQPFAIDVASGVESSPGIKDPHKLKLLFERARTS